MVTNPYFRNFPKNFSPESILMEDLIIESIKIYGNDVFYLQKLPLSQTDPLYGENQGSLFNSAIAIEMYLEDVFGPSGLSESFSRFGLIINDSIKLIVARKSFNRAIPSLTRPREGDLIYIPNFNKLFEIKFVEQEKDFHSMGRKTPYFYYYELQTELFKFNNEIFQTGNPDIDAIGREYAFTLLLGTDGTATIPFQVGEEVYQGVSLVSSTASALVKSYDPVSFGIQIIHTRGVFQDGGNIIGVTSGASANVL